MNPLFRIDFSISDSLKIVRKSVLIYDTIIFGIYDFTILFKNYIGNVYALTGVLAVFSTFCICKRILMFNIYKTLLILIILSINSSYTSIFPVEYSSLPITWFLISIVVLIVVCFSNGIKKNIYFILSLLAVIYFVINLLWMKSNFINSLNQLINILLFLLIMCCVKNLVLNLSNIKHIELTYFFFVEVMLYSLMVIVAYIGYNNSKMFLGTIELMNNRTAYAATFADYSFSTLYIATAMVVVVALIIKRKIKYNRVFWYGLLIIYTFAIIAVNARTGIFAFAVSVGIIIFYESIVVHNIRALLIVPVMLFIGIMMISITLQNRGGQNLLDSSGRIEGYRIALDIFKDYFWVGTGFGIQNYSAITHMAIPHNLFIQYLVQFGIVGFIALLVVIVDIFHKTLKKRGVYIWALLTIFLGAMLIPDILSSHYLIVILILALCCEDPINLVC